MPTKEGRFDEERPVIRRLNEVEENVLGRLGTVERNLLKAIQALVVPPEVLATTAKLTYSIGGNIMGAPVTGNIGNTASPIFTEAAADGTAVAPIGPVVYASDNAAVVSVDPSTGIATLVSAGAANVSALDQGNGLTDSVAFTVSPAPPPAVSASLGYTLNPTRRR